MAFCRISIGTIMLAYFTTVIASPIRRSIPACRPDELLDYAEQLKLATERNSSAIVVPIDHIKDYLYIAGHGPCPTEATNKNSIPG